MWETPSTPNRQNDFSKCAFGTNCPRRKKLRLWRKERRNLNRGSRVLTTDAYPPSLKNGVTPKPTEEQHPPPRLKKPGRLRFWGTHFFVAREKPRASTDGEADLACSHMNRLFKARADHMRAHDAVKIVRALEHPPVNRLFEVRQINFDTLTFSKHAVAHEAQAVRS